MFPGLKNQMNTSFEELRTGNSLGLSKEVLKRRKNQNNLILGISLRVVCCATFGHIQMKKENASSHVE